MRGAEKGDGRVGLDKASRLASSIMLLAFFMAVSAIFSRSPSFDKKDKDG